MTKKLDFLERQVVVPTHRDLIRSKKHQIPLFTRSSDAVFVKKVASTKRKELMRNLEIDNEAISDIAGDFGTKNFLVNFQYARGTIFTKDEMEYMRRVQDSDFLKEICMNEPSSNQSWNQFSKQLSLWEREIPNKDIVPVVEPDTKDYLKKLKIMKDKGKTRCAVIFRSIGNPNDRLSLKKILSGLKAREIESIVFGTYPRKWKVTSASMLLPPIYWGANSISSWIPWGGGKTMAEFLDSDWLFREHLSCEPGLVTYNNKPRTQLLRLRGTAFNTALTNIDTVNQADSILKQPLVIPEARFESLFK